MRWMHKGVINKKKKINIKNKQIDDNKCYSNNNWSKDQHDIKKLINLMPIRNKITFDNNSTKKICIQRT